MANPANRLRTIKTFATLVRYLEEELDWPLAEYDFEDLTFEYSPAELGLKDEDAAKVKTIHQLRPLRQSQPWGIFFVEFEKKRMPVVVLRRVLSHLVLKKRASANPAQAAAWHLDDLLFISAFGDEAADQREIAFAHFHQETGALPTLRVLGWDGADTPLKLDHVAATLKARLCWPGDPGDLDAWRGQWSGAFRHRLGHVIRTADALADRLAGLARGIRDAARTLMDHESERGPLRRLHKAFQTALIHDLSEADFADTYAQTITYGLLTAAISRTDMSEGRYGTALVAENVTDMVPITNPFLREMLDTFLRAGGRQGGINFDELGIQDVVDLLSGDETDLPAILDDFGNRARGEDPVIYFYEHFLAAYDKRLKVQRGVFYTPQPVVSYIVRSVHELLQTEFGLEDGLASTVTWGEMAKRQAGLVIPAGVAPDSPFVQILDPATGTATFLVEVIDVIHRTLTAKWKQQRLSEAGQRAAWNDYVPKHLLPRLYGYELMMAPYAIAHMKFGLKLGETGYRFGSDERARIYLTNSLEPPSDGGKQMAFAELAPALAHEAQAVNAIKRDQRFTVVIGNPPYSSAAGGSNHFISTLMTLYTEGLGVENERKKGALQDDYIRFFALCQWALHQSSLGVIGLITNNSYLDGTLHRAMRNSLYSTFSTLKILNLHGSTRTGVQGGADENVFDIMQGVAIFVGTLADDKQTPPKTIQYAELMGSRAYKYQELQKHWGDFRAIAPMAPYFLLRPLDYDLFEEYRSFLSIREIFRVNSSGIETEKDHFAVDFEAAALKKRLIEFCDSSLGNKEIASKFALKDTPNWNLAASRRTLSKEGLKPELLVRYLFHCFDWRYTYYSDSLITRSRRPVMKHMFNRKNIAIVCLRQVKGESWAHAFAASSITNKFTLSSKSSNVSYHFPLFLTESDGDVPELLRNNGTTLNLQPQLIQRFAKELGLSLNWSEPEASEESASSARSIFAYLYAVLYSPSYRLRYAEYLKLDFPRLPLTSSLKLFRALARLGGELVALHLLESPKLDQHLTTYTGPAQPEVEKVSYARDTVWLDKAQTRGFRGVPEAVWNFHIGGYQVCEKWLKDRKGRVLSPEDIEHYHRIVVALAETIRLMGEIDEVIEEHGGWPAAFSSAKP